MGIPQGQDREDGAKEEERLEKRDIVMMVFPFSNLSGTKIRPALVAAPLPGDDAIFCMITTSPYGERSSVFIDTPDFELGSLYMPSYIRPTRLFTAHRSLVTRLMGVISEEKMAEVRERLISILTGSD